MSQWDKLIAKILSKDPNLRFDDLYHALLKVGYKADQPRGGSSHYTFRKAGHMPITLPKHTPLKKAYISLVSDVINAYLKEAQDG